MNKLLFTVILTELILGGGGRLLEIGTLTVRMYLFFFAVACAIPVILSRRRIPTHVVVFLIISILSIVLASIIGILNGADLNLIFKDIKPLLFIFFILPTFLFFEKPSNILLIKKIITYSSLIMAILYLIVLGALLLGTINFRSFYVLVSPFNEFFFRGTQGFFTYKGFVYLGIGLIFFVYSKNTSLLKVISIAVLTTAIILSGTRGFIVALLIVFFFYLVIPKFAKGNLFYVVFLILPVVISLQFLVNTDLGDKIHSDSIRITQIKEVLENTNPISFFIGHGFGIGVPVREIHMEIAFAEIYHKQGIVGLTLWFLWFLHLTLKYRYLKKFRQLGKPFYLSSIFIFIMSLTNPYMNNPIGLSILIVSYIIINNLASYETKNISLLGKL